MTKRDREGKPGWAGQWDRHRWHIRESRRAWGDDDEPPKPRLRSLDEFKLLAWHKRLAPVKPELSVIEVLLLVLAASIGGFIGVTYVG